MENSSADSTHLQPASTLPAVAESQILKRPDPDVPENSLKRQQVLERLEVSLSHKFKLLEVYRHLQSEFSHIAIDPASKSPLLPFLTRYQSAEIFSMLTATLGSCFSTLAFAELMGSKFDDVPEDWILWLCWIFATLVIYFLSKTVGNAVGADEVIKRIEEEKALFKDEVDYKDEELRFEALTPLYAERSRYQTRRFWGVVFAGLATAVEVGAFYFIFSQGMVAPDLGKYIATLIASFVSFPVGFLKGHDRGVKYDAKVTFFHISQIYAGKVQILQNTLDRVSGVIDDEFLNIVDRKAVERERALREEIEQQKQHHQVELSQQQGLLEALENRKQELLVEQQNAADRERQMEQEIQKLNERIRDLQEQEKFAQAYRERVQDLEKQLSRLLPLATTIGQEGRKLDDLVKSQLSYTVWTENEQNAQSGDDLDAKVQSPIEQILLDGIRQANLPLPEAQYQMRDAEGTTFTRPDFAYPDKKLAIYCDGARYHGPQSNNENWQRDLEINNRLQLMGWRVLRFSGRQINQKLSECLQKIREALGEGAS